MASRSTVTRSRSVARPSGLAEALWACALDDYLSEEEEGEFSKILGKEPTPWYLLETKSVWTKRQNWEGDPRDARTRGGSDIMAQKEIGDAPSEVWDGVSGEGDFQGGWMPGSTPEGGTTAAADPAETPAVTEPDWETDWDMNYNGNSKPKRERSFKNNSSTNTLQRQSAHLTSRTRSHGRLVPVPRVSSKTRSRMHGPGDDETGSGSRSLRSKSRSKSRSRKGHSHHVGYIDEGRQPTASGREKSSARYIGEKLRQSSLNARRLLRTQSVGTGRKYEGPDEISKFSRASTQKKSLRVPSQRH